jgi:release factor glutamine methyltransferase
MKRIRDLYDSGCLAIENVSPAVSSDIKRLLAHFCGVSSLDLIIDKDKEIETDKVVAYEAALKKRAAGIPVQYITNEQDFMGLSFYVDERVLIPRGETELLVARVLELIEERDAKVVMDIGVGSGAICVSVAKLANVSQVYGIDISEDALAVAQINAKSQDVTSSLEFIHSDVFSNVPESLKGRVDILISNPPYIPPEEMLELHDDVKMEPELALYGGQDGLDFYRQITDEGWTYLKASGVLVYEVGHDQGERVKSLMEARGFAHVEFIEDYQGFKRVVIGYKL